MNNLFFSILMFVFVLMCSCTGNSTKNQNKEQEQEQGSMTEEPTDADEKAYHVKENGMVKLEVDGKKFEWVVLGSYTDYLLRKDANIHIIGDIAADKHLQFDFLDLSDSYPGGDLVVEKTLSVSVAWSCENELLTEGKEYRAIINFSNILSEGYSYVANPNTFSYGTIKIEKITEMDGHHLWMKGEIVCSELNMLKAQKDTPANSEVVKMHNLKVYFNSRFRVYK